MGIPDGVSPRDPVYGGGGEMCISGNLPGRHDAHHWSMQTHTCTPPLPKHRYQEDLGQYLSPYNRLRHGVQGVSDQAESPHTHTHTHTHTHAPCTETCVCHSDTLTTHRHIHLIDIHTPHRHTPLTDRHMHVHTHPSQTYICMCMHTHTHTHPS